MACTTQNNPASLSTLGTCKASAETRGAVLGVQEGHGPVRDRRRPTNVFRGSGNTACEQRSDTLHQSQKKAGEEMP